MWAPTPLHAPARPTQWRRARSEPGGRGAAQVEAAGEGAVWVERAAVAALNAAVRRAGERKLALMSAIVDFKKGTPRSDDIVSCGRGRRSAVGHHARAAAPRRRVRGGVGGAAPGPAGGRPGRVRARAAAAAADARRAGARSRPWLSAVVWRALATGLLSDLPSTLPAPPCSESAAAAAGGPAGGRRCSRRGRCRGAGRRAPCPARRAPARAAPRRGRARPAPHGRARGGAARAQRDRRAGSPRAPAGSRLPGLRSGETGARRAVQEIARAEEELAEAGATCGPAASEAAAGDVTRALRRECQLRDILIAQASAALRAAHWQAQACSGPVHLRRCRAQDRTAEELEAKLVKLCERTFPMFPHAAPAPATA